MINRRSQVRAALTFFAVSLCALARAQFPLVVYPADLNGVNGFTIQGAAYDQFAYYSAHLGDVNADGMDDFGSGDTGVQDWQCRYCDPVPGAAYVIFGRPDIAGSGTYAVSTLAPEQRIFMQEISVSSGFGHIAPAGDFNHDGCRDFLVSAPNEDAGFSGAGTCYVVYGGRQLTGGTLDLTHLDGTNGFVIHGSTPNAAIGASSAALGDFNGDGMDDLGFCNVMVAIGGKPQVGQVYIVYGGMGFGASGVASMEDLTAQTGLVISGTSAYEWAGGFLSAAGDFNGDGYADVVFEAGGLAYPSEFYVVFGGPELPPDGKLSLGQLDGTNGLRITPPPGYKSKNVVAPGDVNGDGYADLACGVCTEAPPWDCWVGVVFGGPGVAPDGLFPLGGLDGSNGFKVTKSLAGISEVSALGPVGDLNADGSAEVAVSLSLRAWAVFGRPGLGASGVVALDELKAGEGIKFDQPGVKPELTKGFRGDINHDGIDDWAVQTQYYKAWFEPSTDYGQVHFIFGRRLGDLNCDARVDAFDIDPFVDALIDLETYKAHYPGCDPARCDLNPDGQIDAFDIDELVKALVGK